jgi:DNA-binding response OmpR family regulator
MCKELIMAKEKILGVDDEEDILELLRFNLAREGYHVVRAAYGASITSNHLNPEDST